MCQYFRISPNRLSLLSSIRLIEKSRPCLLNAWQKTSVAGTLPTSVRCSLPSVHLLEGGRTSFNPSLVIWVRIRRGCFTSLLSPPGVHLIGIRSLEIVNLNSCRWCAGWCNSEKVLLTVLQNHVNFLGYNMLQETKNGGISKNLMVTESDLNALLQTFRVKWFRVTCPNLLKGILASCLRFLILVVHCSSWLGNDKLSSKSGQNTYSTRLPSQYPCRARSLNSDLAKLSWRASNATYG